MNSGRPYGYRYSLGSRPNAARTSPSWGLKPRTAGRRAQGRRPPLAARPDGPGGAGYRYKREELDRRFLRGWPFDRNRDSYRG